MSVMSNPRSSDLVRAFLTPALATALALTGCDKLTGKDEAKSDDAAKTLSLIHI